MKNRKRTPFFILNQYFKSISTIFWHSKFYLFHAISSRLYLIAVRKNREEEFDQNQVCNDLIMATLSIPDNATSNLGAKQYSMYEKNCSLLSSGGNIMNKQELIQSLKSGNFLDFCDPEVRQLFNLYSTPKNIRKYSSMAEGLFATLKSSGKFEKYLPLVEKNLIIELIKRLGKLYKSMSFATFRKFMGFFNEIESEKILLYSSLNNLTSVRVDYSANMLLFGHNDDFGNKINNTMVQYSNTLAVVQKSFTRISMKNNGQWANQVSRAVFQAKDYLKTVDDELANNEERVELFKEIKANAGNIVKETSFVPRAVNHEIKQ